MRLKNVYILNRYVIISPFLLDIFFNVLYARKFVLIGLILTGKRFEKSKGLFFLALITVHNCLK